jgi:arylsulfatase
MNKGAIPCRIAGLAALTALSSCQQQEKQSLPNIILINMDDLGYGDITCNGAIGYRTPNIDALANQGLRFTNFYAAQAVSGASRAGLLTGCYPNRIGLTGAPNHNARHGIHPDEMTIAELLKQKNYATGMLGKWHLGHLRPFLPLQNGFDEYLGLPYSNDMWPGRYEGYDYVGDTIVKELNGTPPLPLIDGNDTVDYITTMYKMDQLTSLYTERAVQFIHKNHRKPFFLYVAHSMVHTPLAVSDRFKGKSKQGRFGDVMMEVDWSVGEIMKALKDEHLTSQTWIIFTSDNGPWLNFGAHAGSTSGLREGKGTTFEGGQRVPCLMCWPGHIPAGQVTGQLVSAIDLLPTIASITGTALPVHTIDGVDISCILDGDLDAEPRKEFFYYYNKNSLEAVRMGSWKLCLPHPTRSYRGVLPRDDGKPGPYANEIAPLALYDLRRDPGEWYDVKDLYPDKVEELMQLVAKAREDMGDDLTGAVGRNMREPGRIGKIQ